MFADEAVLKIGIALLLLGILLGVLVAAALFAVAVVGFVLMLVHEHV